MADLPDKISRHNENNEGFVYRRDDYDLLDDLIENYNQLIDYLAEGSRLTSKGENQ